MGEASRKRHEEEEETRIIELEELRVKRVRMEEDEKDWVRRMLDDRVSDYVLYCCLWRAPWRVMHAKVLVYTRDTRQTMITNNILA